RTARAKGLRERAVVTRHALKNALIPVVTIIGIQVGAIIEGAIITETIFFIPGVGRLAVQAIPSQDYPVVQGVVLVSALSYMLSTLRVHVLYAFLGPRISCGGAPAWPRPRPRSSSAPGRRAAARASAGSCERTRGCSSAS